MENILITIDASEFVNGSKEVQKEVFNLLTHQGLGDSDLIEAIDIIKCEYLHITLSVVYQRVRGIGFTIQNLNTFINRVLTIIEDSGLLKIDVNEEAEENIIDTLTRRIDMAIRNGDVHIAAEWLAILENYKVIVLEAS